MRTIDFAIMTVARSPVYIHELIASLRSDLPVRLIAGSPDYEYLERYRDNPAREIIEVSAKGWEHFQNRRVSHRANWNYWRCLTLGPRTSSCEGLLIFEDDVIPARGWEPRFYDIVDQIESDCTGPFVLSLYSPVRLPRPPNSQTYYARYPTANFYGTQAIYFPEEVRSDFARFLKCNGVDIYQQQYDIVLRAYLLNQGIPLFGANPCLVQHVGEVTTGLAEFFHKANRFQSELVA